MLQVMTARYGGGRKTALAFHCFSFSAGATPPCFPLNKKKGKRGGGGWFRGRRPGGGRSLPPPPPTLPAPVRQPDCMQRCPLRFTEGRQILLAHVLVPPRRHPLDSGGREDADVIHQARESALVFGESVALGVDAHARQG